MKSLQLSLLIAAIAIEWAIIVRGLLSEHFANTNKFIFTIHGLAMADFSAAAVLISFGALIGKVTPIQAVMLTLVEVPVSVFNEWLVKTKLDVEDVGGSIVVHVFGAVFGLAAAKVLFKKQWLQSEHHGSIYHSEVFTFVGTAFLWVFWPAFNAVNLVGAERNRAIINSYVALIGSAIAAFVASQGLNKRRHFNIRHIASASLAGGVALGVTANVIMQPWHAWVVGSLAGVVAITGFQFGSVSVGGVQGGEFLELYFSKFPFDPLFIQTHLLHSPNSSPSSPPRSASTIPEASSHFTHCLAFSAPSPRPSSSSSTPPPASPRPSGSWASTVTRSTRPSSSWPAQGSPS